MVLFNDRVPMDNYLSLHSRCRCPPPDLSLLLFGALSSLIRATLGSLRRGTPVMDVVGVDAIIVSYITHHITIKPVTMLAGRVIVSVLRSIFFFCSVLVMRQPTTTERQCVCFRFPVFLFSRFLSRDVCRGRVTRVPTYIRFSLRRFISHLKNPCTDPIGDSRSPCSPTRKLRRGTGCTFVFSFFFFFCFLLLFFFFISACEGLRAGMCLRYIAAIQLQTLGTELLSSRRFSAGVCPEPFATRAA
jgi:hypothetical protein